MENWRKDYLRKLKTKAWCDVMFSDQMREVIYCDDNVDDMTVSLKTVLEELLFKWDVLNDPENVNYTFSNYKKRNFKRVTDGFLKKYYDADIVTEFYKKLITDDNKLP